MSPDSPPAGRRRGVVARALRRVLLALLGEEIDEMRRGLGAHQGAIDAQRADLREVRQESAALQQRVQALATWRAETASRLAAAEDARLELQRHLETMIAQGAAELADLRQAFLTTREEFEAVRDRRVPALEGTAAHLHHAVEASQAELVQLAAVRVAQLESGAEQAAAALAALQATVEAVDGIRLPRLEEDARGMANALGRVQEGLEELAAVRVAQLESAAEQAAAALAALQRGVSEVQGLGEELRDQRLPALAGRVDALLARLHEQLEVTAGLVDRLLAGERLRIDTPATVEAALPEALRTAHLAFLDEFRGKREETLGRVGEHVARLTGQQPVLDLGCGRGELLEALRAAGIEARGVDADPAMVEACRRRGLAVVAGDALEVLAAQPEASLGAVTALHLFEHLPAGRWAAIIQAAATALKEGGVLLVECPNPEALRVGANLFWIDPTHRAPVHRQAAAFVMRALGLEVLENELLHPFPPEQLLDAPGLPGELHALAARLDDLLSGPRDWLLVARKPSRAAAQGNSND